LKNKILLFFFTVMLLTSLSPDSKTDSINTITWALADQDWAPVYYTDPASDTGLSGFWPDVIEELFVNRLNMNLEIERLPWIRAQLQVKNGESDFMVTIPTAERRTYTVVSDDPILNLYMQIFTYAGNERLEEIQKIRSVHDIAKSGLIPVTNLGNGWHAENIDSNGVQTEYIRKDESLPKVLASQRVDILIDVPLTMSYQIKKQGLSSQIVMTDVILDQTDFNLLISKKSLFTGRMAEINRHLKDMIDDGTVDKFYSLYMLSNPQQ